ncbi:hypothetical protein [Microbacterium lushaniae]|uniref:Uncharacterized protein n=1 Tax=Microbacterium lushaniae TaxID=2614639 RepID=A0A5J6L4F8_9MICO|nr:hypothetical protein [Microbacterium lushaniae]QEW03499.1 hypothetical protein F6J85_10560 [Microbacterium lushaniae]
MSAWANATSRMHPALSNQQALALIQEAQSAQNLLRDALEAIRTIRFPILHTDAVFTLGSIGVEKTMKLLLGCAEVERTGQWPSKSTLVAWGHDIDGLADRLVGTAHDGASGATAAGYARTLLSRIESSATLPLLFATLSRYGRSGRFHYLDILATDRPGAFDSPLDHWRRLETHIGQTEASLRGPIPGDEDELEALLARLNDTIAVELEVWWFAVHRLGVQGCFGELGRNVGWALWDPARSAPI